MLGFIKMKSKFTKEELARDEEIIYRYKYLCTKEDNLHKVIEDIKREKRKLEVEKFKLMGFN